MSTAPRPLDRWPFGGLLESRTLALEAENKSPRTLENYATGVTQLADWLTDHDHPTDDVQTVTPEAIRGWLRAASRLAHAKP